MKHEAVYTSRLEAALGVVACRCGQRFDSAEAHAAHRRKPRPPAIRGERASVIVVDDVEAPR